MKRNTGITLTEALLTTAIIGTLAAGTLTQLNILQNAVLGLAETLCEQQTNTAQVISEYTHENLETTKAEWATACNPPTLNEIANKYGITIEIPNP
jgi:type II secretory pathway pseudopilin PulG